MYNIVRTTSEIEELLGRAGEGMNCGTRYSGMSYEEGIYEAVRWLTDLRASHPLPDTDIIDDAGDSDAGL